MRASIRRLFARPVTHRHAPLRVEPLEARDVPAVITVTTTADAVQRNNDLSLREAIELVNGDLTLSALSGAERKLVSGSVYSGVGGTDTIRFKIGSGPVMITAAAPLPSIVKPVTIDGTTQDGWGGGAATGWAEIPVVKLVNGTALSAISGLVVRASGTTVTGLEVSGFTSDGISIYGNGNAISDCYVHDNGTTSVGEFGNGVAVYDGASNNVIGGPSGRLRNVISANGQGVVLRGVGTTGNTILGNYIGTTLNGGAALPTRPGAQVTYQRLGLSISIGASGNTVGGTTPAARNLISGNDTGVAISGIGTTGNVVEGNWVGLNSFGVGEVGNTIGVQISTLATGNTVGGTDPGVRNIISGNTGFGVEVVNAPANNVIGNWVGVDASGLRRPNAGQTPQDGIAGILVGLSNLTVVRGNLVAGNDGYGILVTGNTANNNFSDGTRIEGNLVGVVTDPGGLVPGTFPVPNGKDGIKLLGDVRATVIGGTTAGTRNVISANGWSGVSILDTDDTGLVQGIPADNTVSGNYIGTDAAGTTALANGRWGVYDFDAARTTVGGTAAGAGNLISGNALDGVFVGGTSTDTQIASNLIGTDGAGLKAVGNGRAGVWVYAGPTRTQIGAVQHGNLISGNLYGVLVSGAGTDRTTLVANTIGADAPNTHPIPNSDGVEVYGGATNTAVGLPYQNGQTYGNVISGNTSDGVLVQNAATTGTSIQDNYIGTSPAGGPVLPNGGAGVHLQSDVPGVAVTGVNVIANNRLDGVWVDGAPGAVVRGNNIVGNGRHGVNVVNSFGDVVELNLILGNTRDGVSVHGASSSNRVGGIGAGNTIVANGLSGVAVYGDISPNVQSFPSGNEVLGNFIGAYNTGLGSSAGNATGVFVGFGAQRTTVGGTAPGAGNTIVRNTGHGINIAGDYGTGFTTVAGNLIGTDGTGTRLGNGGYGVLVDVGSHDTLIGSDAASPDTGGNAVYFNGWGGVALSGTTSAAVRGNSVVGNAQHGITVYNSGGARVESNYVVANTLDGVWVHGREAGVRVGAAGAGNRIGGNGRYGVEVDGDASGVPTDTVVADNLIGSFPVPTGYVIPNSTGVFVGGGALRTVVGGPGAGDGNTIVGNSYYGVWIDGTGGTRFTTVGGNWIGTDATGAARGNLADGVRITGGNQDAVIGLSEISPVSAPNAIAFNGGAGVWVDSGSRNSINQNSIYANAGGGIRLNPATGANAGVAAPQLAAGPATGTAVTVTGTVTGLTPGSLAVVEIYANPSGPGQPQGRRLVARFQVLVGADGTAHFSQDLLFSDLGGFSLLTATVTDVFGNTSEFSAPVDVGTGG